jgi:hypothetical protein
VKYLKAVDTAAKPTPKTNTSIDFVIESSGTDAPFEIRLPTKARSATAAPPLMAIMVLRAVPPASIVDLNISSRLWCSSGARAFHSSNARVSSTSMGTCEATLRGRRC